MDILHPHLLSKEQLLEIFKQRHFSIPRLEESSRNELITLYIKHLLPLPKRGVHNGSTPQDVEMIDASQSSTLSNGDAQNGPRTRQRIVFCPSPVENVSHGMKMIRLISNSSPNSVGNPIVSIPQKPTVIYKRTHEISPSKTSSSSSSGISTSSAPSKRQKITWP